MSYLCNRNRETKIANDKVPWMSGLVSGLQNRVRRFESARNLNYHFKALESQALSRVCFLWRPFRGLLENYCSCWVLSSIPALWYGTIGTVFNSLF